MIADEAVGRLNSRVQSNCKVVQLWKYVQIIHVIKASKQVRSEVRSKYVIPDMPAGMNVKDKS